jgi:hypothetical protein
MPSQTAEGRVGCVIGGPCRRDHGLALPVISWPSAVESRVPGGSRRRTRPGRSATRAGTGCTPTSAWRRLTGRTLSTTRRTPWESARRPVTSSAGCCTTTRRWPHLPRPPSCQRLLGERGRQPDRVDPRARSARSHDPGGASNGRRDHLPAPAHCRLVRRWTPRSGRNLPLPEPRVGDADSALNTDRHDVLAADKELVQMLEPELVDVYRAQAPRAPALAAGHRLAATGVRASTDRSRPSGLLRVREGDGSEATARFRAPSRTRWPESAGYPASPSCGPVTRSRPASLAR